VDVADYEEFARGRLPGLLRYAAALTGDTEQARDIVQEVMVRAFTRWRRISRLDYPDAYLRRMVTNEWTSWRRRWSVRTITVLPDEQLHNLAGDAPDAMTAVSERDALRRALDTLPQPATGGAGAALLRGPELRGVRAGAPLRRGHRALGPAHAGRPRCAAPSTSMSAPMAAPPPRSHRWPGPRTCHDH